MSRVRRCPPGRHGSKAEHYEQGSKSKQGHQPNYLGSVGRQQPFIEESTPRNHAHLRSAPPMSWPRSTVVATVDRKPRAADSFWFGSRGSLLCRPDAVGTWSTEFCTMRRDAMRGNSRFAWSHADSAMDAQDVAFRRGQHLEEAVRETTSFGKRHGIGSRQSNGMGFRRFVSVREP